MGGTGGAKVFNKAQVGTLASDRNSLPQRTTTGPLALSCSNVAGIPVQFAYYNSEVLFIIYEINLKLICVLISCNTHAILQTI